MDDLYKDLDGAMRDVFRFIGVGEDFTLADPTAKNTCVGWRCRWGCAMTITAAALRSRCYYCCYFCYRAVAAAPTLTAALPLLLLLLPPPLLLSLARRGRSSSCALCCRRHYPSLQKGASPECIKELSAFFAAHNAALLRQFPHLQPSIDAWL